MKAKNRYKLVLLFVILSYTTTLISCKFKADPSSLQKQEVVNEVELKLFDNKRTNFILKDDDEYKLINSAIKNNYNIYFNGDIVKFDTLIIGKGKGRHPSSYLLITRDSIITHIRKRDAYKHNLKLKNNLSINIKRKVKSASITIINEKDTLNIASDFAGINHPFIRSSGSIINVNTFDFTCDYYNSDVFVFGDSYVNYAAPIRWPYYIYQEGYKFLCDGLPGGKSINSYDFINSAFSIHKPKYVVWCLGMNDIDSVFKVNDDWKLYIKKVMDLCAKNNVTLILATIPTVPQRDNTEKNKFIRESGFRYIDFDKAVSDGKGNWKEGMLSEDGVHPTIKGAKALAEKFIENFPEIKKYKKIRY